MNKQQREDIIRISAFRLWMTGAFVLEEVREHIMELGMSGCRDVGLCLDISEERSNELMLEVAKFLKTRPSHYELAAYYDAIYARAEKPFKRPMPPDMPPHEIWEYINLLFDGAEKPP